MMNSNMSNKRKLLKIFSDIWHLLDLFIVTTFIISIVLRVHRGDEHNGHYPLAITSFFTILRFMKNFYGFERLGPYLVMLSKMVQIYLMYHLSSFFLFS